MTVLAQAVEANVGGWYLGLAIGMAVVVVVAILVGWILYLALKIGQYATMINEALQQSYQNTKPLADLKTTIDHATVIVGGLQRGRARLGG